MSKQGKALRVTGGLAIAFGILTVASGGSTLLGRLEMGAVIPFVLWFNTLAGLAYVAAGLGMWWTRRWTLPLSISIFAATLLVFAGFGIHVAQGGAFEMRTVFAMALRSAAWGGIAMLVRRAFFGR